MAIGLIIIGDEILSGKRVDQHLPKVIALLKERGLSLDWAEYVGDDRDRITAVLRRSFASGDIVFSTGGIGATPDDHTRQCAAAALGLGIEIHAEARVLIHERVLSMAAEAGQTVDIASIDYANRLKMGEFPIGAEIIPNSFNKIPGFAIREHYFVPGFPVMAWPMIAWVLDTHYAHLFHQHPTEEKSVLVFEVAESTLTPMMELLEEKYPQVKVFSLPSVATAAQRRHIELGVKGEPGQVELAFAEMLAALDDFEMEYLPTPEI